MSLPRRLVFLFALAALLASGGAAVSAELAPIPRRLPPPGIEIPDAVRNSLRDRVARLRDGLARHAQEPQAPDVEVFVKAVELALLHGEFYKQQDFDAAKTLLDEAERRLEQIASAPWNAAKGLVVRGYRSSIDGSPQPYGLVIPADLNLQDDQPAPLYVWLHGRGDSQTDLHFIRQRMTQVGQISPPGAIVLHPFGRQCIGFKSAGEIDVLEAVEHVQANYPIDPNRVALMGFSMGGAGAWHLGAHYADRWVALSPGAGFAETARYTRLRPEDYPPKYEQLLWGVYDVPAYVRNLFNLPVVAYSGERDKQIQAARVMEEAFQEGRELRHVIGPGVEHKYHPDSLAEILAIVGKAVEQGRDPAPEEVHLQTRTLRYSRMFWVEALRLDEHWRDTRIDAAFANEGDLTITTRNVAALRLHDRWRDRPQAKVVIDGQTLDQPLSAAKDAILVKEDGQWRWTGSDGVSPRREKAAELVKRPGLQGPIDDVFLAPFLVVAPEGVSPHPQVQRWVEFESAHFRERWRSVFRGELRWKSADEVTPEDFQQYHVIFWGDPHSNRWIRRIHEKLPVRWNGAQVQVGDQAYDAAAHVPALIYPNPLHPEKYVVLNSGPTFREDHDRTNSLQNPKLPDWAVIDLTQPPTGSAPGRIAAAGFFNETWRLP